ncbi:MIF4G domain-containing protein B [Ditylenchus destructor]|nr:MIF4G domain-containing protein B [Ditylenchus destructor]
MASANDEIEMNDTEPLDRQHRTRKSNRPSMQIYQPPGLRNSPSSKRINKEVCDADQVSNASSNDSRSSNQSDPSKAKPSYVNPQPTYRKSGRFSRFEMQSKFLRDSPRSYEGSTDSGDVSVSSAPITFKTNETQKDLVRPTFISGKLRKKQASSFGKKEMEEILNSLAKLNIGMDKNMIDKFSAGDMLDESLARQLAQSLVHHAIEENKRDGRQVARLCASLLECPSGAAFHHGFMTSILQYFDCREQLRSDHSRVWINFLNFVSDLYSSVGFHYEGGLVDTIFSIFDYMLKRPVLESLKIEELECLIASLLSVGYDLERNCPDQLSDLRNLIRDAFIEVTEPWARKMIMLLMELGASGYSLPPEANEYYFQ